MQKAIKIRQIDMRMFHANLKIDQARKDARIFRLENEKENPFRILKKMKQSR